VSPTSLNRGGTPLPPLEDHVTIDDTLDWFDRLLGAMRLALVTIWVPLSVGFEALLLLVPGTSKIRWTRIIWRGMCLILSIKINQIGQAAGTLGGRRGRARGERPVIYVANHCSWLDIPVLGARFYSVFVAKGDIRTWPIMGLVSKIGRSIYVSRHRSSTAQERDTMVSRMIDGDNLILFPEGTSSDGCRVLNFTSTFFAIAKPPHLPASARALGGPTYPKGMAPLIQPVSIAYDTLDGLPVHRRRRGVFAWYGDMELGPHVWQFVKHRGKRVSVLMHKPLAPEDFKTRKALAQAAFKVVAEGAAQLRQNVDGLTGWHPLMEEKAART